MLSLTVTVIYTVVLVSLLPVSARLTAPPPAPAPAGQVMPDYPPFCSRVLVDNDWVPTLQRDNVTLVPAQVHQRHCWRWSHSHGHFRTY